MNHAFKMMVAVVALGVLVIGNPKLTFSNQLLNVSDYTICKKSVFGGYNNPSLYIEEAMKSYVLEAIRRNLKCEANLFDTKAYRYRTMMVDVLSIAKDNIICELHDFGKHIQNEAKRRGLDCGVNESGNKTVIASKPKTKTYTKPKSTISSAELNASKREADELRKKLAALEGKQKQEQQRINSDNQEPIINAFTKQDGSNATISGRVTDNAEVAEVLIDGEQLSLTNNGTFKTELYIPRNGLNVEIVAFDRKGNKASKLLKIERGEVAQATGPLFDRLNPSGKRVKSNPNALALIIGVADYSRTTANALYADKDAQQFYDYATMKLGIPSGNIKELVNDKADRVEIGLAVQDWIARSTKSGKTDIYLFFAGHGLVSDDGKNMYLLPHDGSPRLLKASAIRRKELFNNIQQSNPRSVTQGPLVVQIC